MTPFQRLKPQEAHDDYLPQVAAGAITLLDVRQPIELMQDGYIKGSLNIPTDQLNERAWEEIPQDKPVIVYCAHGIRSAAVGQALAANGWETVYDIEGGIDLWARSGLPVMRDA